MKKGCPYGTHRVISPKGVLPQPADVIDNNMEIYDNEVLIDVKTLNIDSASFTEIVRRVLKQKACRSYHPGRNGQDRREDDGNRCACR